MTLQTSLDVCYTMSFQDAVEYFENRHLPPHPTILPAWSLHRLIEIVPKLVKVPKPNYGWNGEDLMFHINDELHILYEDLCIENEEYRFCSKYFYKSNLYDNFIDCIEWLIKEGYFNKEYLEE